MPINNWQRTTGVSPWVSTGCIFCWSIVHFIDYEDCMIYPSLPLRSFCVTLWCDGLQSNTRLPAQYFTNQNSSICQGRSAALCKNGWSYICRKACHKMDLFPSLWGCPACISVSPLWRPSFSPPYEMDFMCNHSMDLPYLAVDGHARMALCSGRCLRYYSCAYYCVGRSRNAEDYAFFKGLNNF